MKSFPTARTDGRRRGSPAFTLVEVLAAMLLMAIIIPVTLQGMTMVSRAAQLGQRKTAAMRVAERVINEQLALVAQGQTVQNSASGTETDGGLDYPWTMQTAVWPQDTMTKMTVRITFTLEGHSYEMSLSTLFDPTANTPGTPGTTGTPTS